MGAQSIAPAQSIAHGQIGDSISKKNYIFQKLYFTKDKKMINFAADFLTKFRIFYLNSRKYSCPQKAVFVFCRNFTYFFLKRRIFVDFKTEFSKVSRSHAYIPISRWCYGEHFFRKIISKTRLSSERWSTSAQSIAHFGFAAKKAHLE